MNTILVYPENEETWKALKAVMQALKIKFEITTANPEASTIPAWHKVILDDRLEKRDASKSISWEDLQTELDREFL